MKKTLVIAALFAVAFACAAVARSPLGTRNDWSTLSAERLQQLPPQISSAIRTAQRACGDDEPRIRTGFMRYLKARNGELISLHFDQFYCSRSWALCNSAGCLHRVFVSNGREQTREVWHGQVHDIDMDDQAGRPTVKIHCGDSCNSTLQWNGRGFSQH